MRPPGYAARHSTCCLVLETARGHRLPPQSCPVLAHLGATTYYLRKDRRRCSLPPSTYRCRLYSPSPGRILGRKHGHLRARERVPDGDRTRAGDGDILSLLDGRLTGLPLPHSPHLPPTTPHPHPAWPPLPPPLCTSTSNLSSLPHACWAGMELPSSVGDASACGSTRTQLQAACRLYQTVAARCKTCHLAFASRPRCFTFHAARLPHTLRHN